MILSNSFIVLLWNKSYPETFGPQASFAGHTSMVLKDKRRDSGVLPLSLKSEVTIAPVYFSLR